MSFEITLLGSSSAIPTSKRNLPAHVLNVHERFFLIDCGEGTQIQLRANKIRFGKIHHIFISHLHGDHMYGLYGLISTYNLLNRKHPLHIFGPEKLEDILNNHVALFEKKLHFPIIFHVVDPIRNEIIYQDDKLIVESIPLKHKIPSCGFLFKETPYLRNIKKEAIEKYNIPLRDIHGIKEGKDFKTEDGDVIPNKKLTKPAYRSRSYAYCSDTAYTEQITPIIKEVDCLFHEATYLEEMKRMAVKTGHSTAADAAKIAKKAGVKKLIIGHFSARYKNLLKHKKEAQEIFPGAILAEDGMNISIPLMREAD